MSFCPLVLINHLYKDLGSTQQLLSTQPQHNMNDMKDGTLSHEITPEQFEFAKPNQPVKKGKQKSKEGGHSSLLHVKKKRSSFLTVHSFFMNLGFY